MDLTFSKEDLNLYDAQLNILAPGLIDPHMHIESSMMTACAYAEPALLNGTTTILPTTLTATFDDTIKAIKGLNKYIKSNQTNIAGVHLEGPFINPKKLGAQPKLNQAPNLDFLKK